MEENNSSNSNSSSNSSNSNNSNNSSNHTSDSLYSYSYVNQDSQENQERNPNYYEQKEQEERIYTTGQYASEEPDIDSQNVDREPEKPQKKKRFHFKNKKHGFGMQLTKCAAMALVFGLVAGTVFYGTGYTFDYAAGGVSKKNQTAKIGNTNDSDAAKDSKDNISASNVSTKTSVIDASDIVEDVMPSIVSITNMGQMTGNLFGQEFKQEAESAGSGIIIGQTDDAIFVATNNHVVANSTQLTVKFIDDQTVTAEIKGTDPSTDLAVISVAIKDISEETLEKIKVATLGNSDEIKVGQGVIAIGNALGYGQSVTTGVISAVDREVTVQDESTGTTVTNNLIQTDAAINPGNSGGALLNMYGEVIGINSVKYNDTQVEGMGYAIPITAAEPIISDLINREVVDEADSAYLGVSGQDVTTEISAAYGMPEGLYITRVEEGSAAENAGIHKGDIITKFDGKAVTSMQGLREILKYYAASSQVEIVVQTSQSGEWKEQTLTAVMGRKNN